MIATIAIPILKRKKYAIITIVTTLIFSALSYYLTIVNVAFKSLFVLIEMDGIYFTLVSFLLAFFISLFFGVYLALIIFERDIKNTAGNTRGSLAGIGGTMVNIAVTGCHTCGVPFLAIFGAPLGLMFLPFHGLEIKIASFFLLLLSLHLLTKNIEKKLMLCGANIIRTQE